MKKIATHKGYDYYIGDGAHPSLDIRTIFNVVPEGQPAPATGYYYPHALKTLKGNIIDLNLFEPYMYEDNLPEV